MEQAVFSFVQKPSKIYSRDQYIADLVYKHFKKELPFGRIMKLIKNYGHQWIYECWNETRQSTCRNPVALFLWKVKQAKMVYEQV